VLSGLKAKHVFFQTVAQLCVNLERLAQIYTCDDHEKLFELGLIPTDYVVTQLEALTVIYHYCLLDSYAQVSNKMLNCLLWNPYFSQDNLEKHYLMLSCLIR
jgi:hypothetical protein